jgi:hypothetical protein
MKVDPKSPEGKHLARDRVRQLIDPLFTASASEGPVGENPSVGKIASHGRMPPDGPRVLVVTPSGLRSEIMDPSRAGSRRSSEQPADSRPRGRPQPPTAFPLATARYHRALSLSRRSWVA